VVRIEFPRDKTFDVDLAGSLLFRSSDCGWLGPGIRPGPDHHLGQERSFLWAILEHHVSPFGLNVGGNDVEVHATMKGDQVMGPQKAILRCASECKLRLGVIGTMTRQKPSSHAVGGESR